MSCYDLNKILSFKSNCMLAIEAKKQKPGKFETICESDEFSHMHNKTWLQIRDKFEPKPALQHEEYEEIFVREKIDGTSLIMVLSLCETLPEKCVFLHTGMQTHYNDSKKGHKKILQNAWHPYYQNQKHDSVSVYDSGFYTPNYRQQPHGWFYVQLFSAYGFENERADSVSKYEPFYLHDEVMFQLHRDIAGWDNLEHFFSNIRESNRKRKASGSSAPSNNLKMLVFRCEMALPGKKALAVTHYIVNSWLRPSQQNTSKNVNFARKNFQIFLLNFVFNMKAEFIQEMSKGFRSVSLGHMYGIYSANQAFDFCSLFSREEIGQALCPAFDKLSDLAMQCSQNAFLLERLIGIPDADDRGYGHVYSQWIVNEFQFVDKSTSTSQRGFMMLCMASTGEDVDIVQRNSMAKRAYGMKQFIDSDGKLYAWTEHANPEIVGKREPVLRCAMPVITTPRIILHEFNDKQSKNITPDLLKATADGILAECQFTNKEGAVISYKRWDVEKSAYESSRSATQEVHCKYKDNFVSIHVPFYSCSSEERPGNHPFDDRCDKNGLIESMFPMFKQSSGQKFKSPSVAPKLTPNDEDDIDNDEDEIITMEVTSKKTSWPVCHVYCYGPIRAQCNAQKLNVIATIKHNQTLKIVSSLAIASDLGVTHSAQRAYTATDEVDFNGNETWSNFGVNAFETPPIQVNALHSMPKFSLSGNWDGGRPLPVILTPLHSEDGAIWQIRRARQILRERESYFQVNAAFPADYCQNTFKKITAISATDFLSGLANNGQTLQKYKNLNDIICKSTFCKFVFHNIFSTMFLLMHMRLMLMNSVHDEKCAFNFIEIWGHSSKVLRQLICTDLRFATSMAKDSNAAYRPGTWPCFLFIEQELNGMQTLDTITKKIVKIIEPPKTTKEQKKKNEPSESIFLQQIRREFERMIPGQAPASVKTLCDTFIAQFLCYRSFLEYVNTHQKNPTQTFSSNVNCLYVNEQRTPSSQKQDLEKFYKQIFGKAGNQSNVQIKSQAKQLVTKWTQSEWIDEEIKALRYYDANMVVAWWKERDKQKDPDMTHYEAKCLALRDILRNNTNMLSQYLCINMQCKFALFCTLHGVLALDTDICDFDPTLHYELQQKAPTDQNAATILHAITNLNQYDNKSNIRYAKQHRWNEIATQEQNGIDEVMREFYTNRLKNVPIPTSVETDNYARSACRHLSVGFVCSVFANWHFGDLGDDARVESTQLK